MTRASLFISREIGERDYLTALEYGRVVDGQPDDHFRFLSGTFRFCLDRPGGRDVGFEVLDLPSFDADTPEHEPIWHGPRFDVPTLGLADASASEVVLGARAELGEELTMNRAFFHAALQSEGAEAAGYWRACLECGDMMAHYALGYTLYGLEDFHGAYRHLRRYTELVPTNAWAWCWLGKAATALGETGEARAAFERAIELEAEGGFETDAPELLGGLLAGGEGGR